MMRSVVCILLLIVYCFCISDSRRVRPTASSGCGGRFRHFCLASAKNGRPDTDVLIDTEDSNIRMARSARERREVRGVGGAREGDPDKSVKLSETMTLLEKILGDIEGRLDPPPVPDSVNKKTAKLG